MKKQRGSAAVMALVFMLFLSLAGGAWVTMLAHENATAMNDEKDQQAWYAAEAGMKRAKAEIVAKNGDMIWLTDDNKFPNKGKTIAVDTGKDSSDANKALYAVYVGNTTEDSRVTHKIISVGYYMDSTKIISEDLTTNSSGTGGGGDEGKATAGIGLANAGKNIIVKDAAAGGLNGQLYANGSVATESEWGQNKISQYVHDTSTGSDAQKLYTHINASWFISKAEISSKYAQLFSHDGTAYIPENTTMYMDDTIADNPQINAESGSRLYIYGTGASKIRAIAGPTGDAKPVIVVCEDGIDSSNLGISGNVIIISNKKVSIRGWGIINDARVMIFSNEEVELINGLNVNQAFVSSDKDIIYYGGSFVGQMQAKESITIKSAGTVTFSDAVIKKYGMPDGIEES